MTREEYERLLKSDYWKGYSYSLIKERNFTCEDCGRRFPNERNKLQVHHLVYRDVNPWSYRPDEVVVLCEECHRKRHGIKEEPSQNTNDTWRGFASSSSTDTFSDNDQTNLDGNRINRGYRYTTNRRRRFKFKYVLFILLLTIVLYYCWDRFSKQKEEIKEKRATESIEKTTSHRNTQSNGRSKRTYRVQSADKSATSTSSNEFTDDYSVIPQQEEYNVTELSTNEHPEEISGAEIRVQSNPTENREELSTLEILERRNHTDVVKRARRAGVDTSGSTIEILERINHADVVKRAQRAGVSTQGSTLDLLERINHADVVKRARHAGIDTSGSTLDILERINHADVVKRAKRAGVSTEGTTLEILERINRKELERYNN